MRAKIISSLEKCFLEDNMDTKQSVTSGSMLKNENYQFQICYTMKMLSDGRPAMKSQEKNKIKQDG